MAPGDQPTAVEFTVEGSGRESTLRLVHAGWPTAKELDNVVQMHMQGWAFFLQNLKTHLEEGKDARKAVLGMKTG